MASPNEKQHLQETSDKTHRPSDDTSSTISCDRMVNFYTRKRSSDSGNSSCDDNQSYYSSIRSSWSSSSNDYNLLLNNTRKVATDSDDSYSIEDASHPPSQQQQQQQQQQQISNCKSPVKFTHNSCKKKSKESVLNKQQNREYYQDSSDKIDVKQNRSSSFGSSSTASSSIYSLSDLCISSSKSTPFVVPCLEDDYQKSPMTNSYNFTKGNSQNYSRIDPCNRSKNEDVIKPILKKRSTLFHSHSLGDQGNIYADRNSKPQSILKKKFSFDNRIDTSNLRPILKRNSLDLENKQDGPKTFSNNNNNNIYNFINRNANIDKSSGSGDGITTKSCHCQKFANSITTSSSISSNNQIDAITLDKANNRRVSSVPTSEHFKIESPTILRTSPITTAQQSASKAKITHFNINKLKSIDSLSTNDDDKYLNPILKYRNDYDDYDGDDNVSSDRTKESPSKKPVRPILKKYS